MKKLISLVCLLTIVVMSAQAQLDQQKLGRVMRQLMSVRTEQNKVQKSFLENLDSALYGFDKHQYSGNVETVSTYYVGESENEFELEGVEYTISNTEGKVIETGMISNGDTLSKTVYTYVATNADVLMQTYENDGEGLSLNGEIMFYGVKNIQFAASSQLTKMINMDILFCDSLQMFEYDGEDSIVNTGYFTYDADGLPVSFVMGLNISGLPLDFVCTLGYTNKLPTSALLSISMMGGIVTADVISASMAYDADGQLTIAEIIPIPNDLFDPSTLGFDRSKMVSTYANKKLLFTSNYSWNQIDSLNGEYKLENRNYYTYYADNGNVDTVYHYAYNAQPAGIADLARIEVSVSPNPVKDMLNIRGQEEATEVSVFNTEGRLVLRSRVEAVEGSISMQSLSAGMYFIKLSNTKGVSVQQIVKQ